MQEKLHQTIKLNENDNICPEDNNTVDELKVKLQFLKKKTYHCEKQQNVNKI